MKCSPNFRIWMFIVFLAVGMLFGCSPKSKSEPLSIMVPVLNVPNGESFYAYDARSEYLTTKSENNKELTLEYRVYDCRTVGKRTTLNLVKVIKETN